MISNWINDYKTAREYIIARESDFIIKKEYELTALLVKNILMIFKNIKEDFDNAYITRKYWESYAPIQRGYKPRGEAYPWGEVGEKVVEAHVYSSLKSIFEKVSFPGIPYGHDIRFLTGDSFIHIDVKSTGPTDNQDEIVSSPNQVTGNGVILPSGLVYNDLVDMKGPRVTRSFRPELAPFYLINNAIIPVLTYYIKIVYDVIAKGNQPLKYIELICVPNGIPLFVAPNFNHLHPGILTPGKDEVTVERRRTRIKLNPLSSLGGWRCQKIYMNRDNKIAIMKRNQSDSKL